MAEGIAVGFAALGGRPRPYFWPDSATQSATARARPRARRGWVEGAAERP